MMEHLSLPSIFFCSVTNRVGELRKPFKNPQSGAHVVSISPGITDSGGHVVNISRKITDSGGYVVSISPRITDSRGHVVNISRGIIDSTPRKTS